MVSAGWNHDELGLLTEKKTIFFLSIFVKNRDIDTGRMSRDNSVTKTYGFKINTPLGSNLMGQDIAGDEPAR